MSADADTTIHESRLLRASHSRNRRRYSQIAPVVSLLWLFCSYRLARPMSVFFAMQACRSTQPLSGTFIVNKYRKPGQASPAPMLLFPFLLFQFKLALFLCFPFFPAHSPALCFQLLLLQFQSLLRFRTDPDSLYLPARLTPDPFGITIGFLYSSCHSRTES